MTRLGAVGISSRSFVAPSRVYGFREVALVAAIALVVRLVVALVWARNPVGLSDPAIYSRFARSIADGDGYRSMLGESTTYYPPGYPYFLGGVQVLADIVGLGNRLALVASIVQSALGAVAAGATAVAGHFVGRLYGRARIVGLVAGLVLALWPNFVLYSTTLLSETLFVALFAISLACLFSLQEVRSPRPWLIILMAASFGLATLVRPQALLVIPAAIIAWLIARLPVRRILVLSASLVLGVVVCVVPWMIRNAVVMNDFVPISTNTGDNLCIGFNDEATGGFGLFDPCATDGGYVDSPEVEVARDSELRSRALRWIVDNPGQIPGLSVSKVRVTFGSDRDSIEAFESYGEGPRMGDGVRSALGTFMDVAWWAIVAMSLVGIISLLSADRLRSPQAQVLLWTTLAGLVVPVAFFGDGGSRSRWSPASHCWSVPRWRGWLL